MLLLLRTVSSVEVAPESPFTAYPSQYIDLKVSSQAAHVCRHRRGEEGAYRYAPIPTAAAVLLLIASNFRFAVNNYLHRYG